jgi:hypothetical protein
VKIRRLTVQAQDRGKFHETPFQSIAGSSVTCHPSYSGSTNRKILVQVSLGIKRDPISKITNIVGSGEK